MPAAKQEKPQVTVASRDEWRNWLTVNHRQTESIWLVTWKKGDPRSLPYDQLVEEALCFGWVDSLTRKLDETRSMLLLSPRRRGSAWSKLNKTRVDAMIAAGRMTEAGLAVIEEAKQSGLWTKLDAVDALIAPPDLLVTLERLPPAAANWSAFPRSVRRGILEWIEQAKRPETRERRINETAERAQRNERANQWRG